MAGGSRILLDHPRQLGPNRLERGHLGVDLSHPIAQQRLTMAAGTQALVADSQQLPDLASRRPTRWALLMNCSRSTASCWYWR